MNPIPAAVAAACGVTNGGWGGGHSLLISSSHFCTRLRLYPVAMAGLLATSLAALLHPCVLGPHSLGHRWLLPVLVATPCPHKRWGDRLPSCYVLASDGSLKNSSAYEEDTVETRRMAVVSEWIVQILLL